MRLKLLAVTIPLLLVLGGCTVHFPLADNGPSLTSQDESAPSSNDMGYVSTAPDTHELGRGNSAPTPDVPR